MDLIRKLIISLTISAIFSCSSSKPYETLNDSSNVELSEKDSSKEIYLSIEDTSIHINNLLNPFLILVDTSEIVNCDYLNSIKEIFNCVINQFQVAHTPIHVGPSPDPREKRQLNFFDSVFIFKCLHDTSFFETAADMRVYGYHKSKIIDRNENYILCLILFGFNVGFEYQLCSFTNLGELVSKEIVGGEWVGEYQIFGSIHNNKTFEVKRNDFGFNKSSQTPFIAKKSIKAFRIENDGKFTLL